MSKINVQGPDSYEFSLIGTDKEAFLGYNSSQDKTTVSPMNSVRGSKNVYLKTSKTYANRPGLKTRGANDTTVAGVLSSWEWNNSLGRVLPLRVANNKLQVESSILGTPVWYELFITSTLLDPAASLTRMIFQSWYDSVERKDRLVFVRGDDAVLHWSGGMSLVLSGTTNTITKSDTTTTWAQDGFATNTAGEMKIIISGVEYTYTGGFNTQTLTGVSPDASALTNGLVAIQSVQVAVFNTGSMPTDTGYLVDMCKVIGNQLYLGSYKSRLVYISAAANFNNFTIPSPPLAGSAELLTLDNSAKGIACRQGNAWISAGTKDWYEIVFSNITVSATLTRQTVVTKQPTSDLVAAYSHEMIDNLGDDIIYLAQDQQVRDIGTFVGILNGQKFPMVSLDIMTELSEEDFTNGQLKVVGDLRLGNTIYITAPNSGRDYMFSMLEETNNSGGITSQRIWHPPQVRNISRFSVISGVTYGHSNANPMIYQVWNTNQWHDDSPSGENLAYTSVLTMAYRSFGRRQGKWAFNKALFIGYMSQGTQLDTNIYFDYQGATAKQNPNISSNTTPSKQFLAQSAPALGDSTLGDNPLGDGLNSSAESQDLVPKFYKICSITALPCYEVGLEVYSSNLDDRWELMCLGVNPWLASQQAVELQK